MSWRDYSCRRRRKKVVVIDIDIGIIMSWRDYSWKMGVIVVLGIRIRIRIGIGIGIGIGIIMSWRKRTVLGGRNRDRSYLKRFWSRVFFITRSRYVCCHFIFPSCIPVFDCPIIRSFTGIVCSASYLLKWSDWACNTSYYGGSCNGITGVFVKDSNCYSLLIS